MMPRETIPMMIVASALTSGLTPRRTLEKITIGKVDDPGPDTKLATTRSSKLSVKANNQPDTIAGAIAGNVISKKTRAGFAPRSRAASSMDRSMSTIRDWITTAEKAAPNVAWAMMMVIIPRPAGQPIRFSIPTNNSNRDRPMITSGITKGAVIARLSSGLVRNRV